MAKRTVVITGASSGFGQGTALRFAQNRDNVVLAARRKDLLEEVAERCESLGANALAIETDVS
ncbi:MAG: SDR family NAD(P)-dependent oxidoreductase, partial [Acidobacteriales bacterium]|nr:SDR family NAD(P)-dependent oxidoreductase [Terriglobales bacterium]